MYCVHIQYKFQITDYGKPTYVFVFIYYNNDHIKNSQLCEGLFFLVDYNLYLEEKYLDIQLLRV